MRDEYRKQQNPAVQARQARALREAWGDRPCAHPAIDKEYDLGAATGDWCCTACGHCEAGSNWNHLSADDGHSDA